MDELKTLLDELLEEAEAYGAAKENARIMNSIHGVQYTREASDSYFALRDKFIAALEAMRV